MKANIPPCFEKVENDLSLLRIIMETRPTYYFLEKYPEFI